MESPGGYQLIGRTLPIWNPFTRTGPFTPGKPWLLRNFDQASRARSPVSSGRTAPLPSRGAEAWPHSPASPPTKPHSIASALVNPLFFPAACRSSTTR